MADKKSTKNKESTEDTCFVITPFNDFFDDCYKEIYIPAIEKAGLKAERADDISRPGGIVKDIWDGIKKCKLVLADLTDKNPNVFYELGLANAINKPVVMITENINDIPFDLQESRVIEYWTKSPKWCVRLEEKIAKSIKETLEDPDKAIPPAFIKQTDTKTIEKDEIDLRLTMIEGNIRRMKRMGTTGVTTTRKTTNTAATMGEEFEKLTKIIAKLEEDHDKVSSIKKDLIADYQDI